MGLCSSIPAVFVDADSSNELILIAPSVLFDRNLLNSITSVGSPVPLSKSRQFTVEKWAGDPEGENRGIVHPKDLDFSCDMIPIVDILPSNIDELLQKSKSNRDSYVWEGSTRRHLPSANIGRGCVEGITLRALEDILDANVGSEYYETKQLVDNIFSSHTKDVQCTMLRKLKGTKDSNGCQAVGKMEYFVSYSWSYKIGDLIAALREIEVSLKRKPQNPVYFFIDCVCINQWNPAQHINDLDQTIGNGKGLVMVIIDWKNPVPFKRAWCLFEISVALSLNIPIHVAMTKDAMRTFRKALFSDFDTVLNKIGEIDVRDAKATFEKDLFEIRGKIQEMIGYSALNNRVIGELKNWLVNEGERMLNYMSKSDKNIDQRDWLDKLEIFAKLKRHMGDYMAAASMYSEIYNKRLELLGPENIATLVAQCNHGNHSRELRRFDIATDLLTNCAKISTKTLGENHTITLIAETGLGLLYKILGNLEEAEKLLAEVQKKGADCQDRWARDWDKLSRANNLALVLELSGKTDQACILFEDCYIESEKMLGQRHEFCMIDMHNLGAALIRADDNDAAARILGKCYQGRIDLLPDGHVRTLMTLWWWAISLVKLGKLDMAREQLLEVIYYLEKFYGSSKHKRVCICRDLYEAITPTKWKKNLHDDGKSDL